MKILITGSSSGLGKAMAVDNQHEIYCHTRDAKDSELNGDINSPSFIPKFNDFLVKNKIQVLVNNAAIYEKKSILDMEIENIELMIRTNLTTPIVLTKFALQHFKNIGGGTVVNINSLAGKNSSPDESVYSATKFGLRGFSNSIRYEVKPNNIKILDIYLGAMSTKMTVDRVDRDLLINPAEVSKIILSLIADNKTFGVSEIEIRRK